MWPNPQDTADLVTFTKEIFNGKFHFLCNAYSGPEEAVNILWNKKKHWKYVLLWSAFLVDNVLETELWQLQWNMSLWNDKGSFETQLKIEFLPSHNGSKKMLGKITEEG